LLGVLTACVQPYHRLPGPVPHAQTAPHQELQPLPDSPSSPARQHHRVGTGENLYRIALKYDVTVPALMKANGIDDVQKLQVGQTLVIPLPVQVASAGTARTEEVSTQVAPIVVSSSSARRDDVEPEAAPAPRTSFGRGTLSWPLRGVLYGRFGKRGKEMHDGLDLAAPLGTPVRTAAPGTVLFAGEQRGYGLIAVVEHANGLVTLYAHNQDLRVKSGQRVREGQVIATVGESGKTSGPHLHFEVRERGRPVDPLSRLGPAPRQ